MRFVVPLVPGTVETALRRARLEAPTYDGPDVLGLSKAPGGFALIRRDVVIGHGHEDFARSRDGLRAWVTHQIAGVHVAPRATTVRLGGVHVVTFGTPLGALAAPCRVTRVTDDTTRWGYSYHTLPGHPEVGEEAFDVTVDGRGDVHLTIVAVSRHAGTLRLAGPVARLVQRGITDAYCRALRRHVARR